MTCALLIIDLNLYMVKRFVFRPILSGTSANSGPGEVSLIMTAVTAQIGENKIRRVIDRKISINRFR